MKIKMLSKDKKAGKISFEVNGSNPAFMNAVRRIIMAEVPTMAIEEVEFRKNGSILYDEIVAHRLGLIPLKTDLKSYELPQKPEDLQNPKCSLKLSLKVKSEGIVTSGQIESEDKKVVPVFDGIPIVQLLKGQQIEFEATAILGKGKDHVKWSPGIAWYRYDIDEDNVEKPSGKEDPSEKGTSPNPDQQDFVFFVESFGQLSPSQMVDEALDIFEHKLDEFGQRLKDA